MITLLSKIFIKDNKNYKDPTVRRSYGILCSLTGIAFNVILFIAKFVLGLVTCSLAIQADSFNNLSDAGSSILSLLGFRISSRKPTDANPFGSGRIEYISSLVISVIVMTMGISVLRDSIIGIIEKSTSSFSIVAVSVLSCSIVVKAYMASYNTVIGKKIDSSAMRAVASDSLGDVAATFAVLVSGSKKQSGQEGKKSDRNRRERSYSRQYSFAAEMCFYFCAYGFCRRNRLACRRLYRAFAGSRRNDFRVRIR